MVERPANIPRHPRVIPLWGGCLLALLGMSLSLAPTQGQTRANTADADDMEEVVVLDPQTVEETMDDTGVEDVLTASTQAPFGNELLWDVAFKELPLEELDRQLAELIRESPPPAVIAAGSDPLTFAGFPTLIRQNDYTSFGVSDVLNVERNTLIAGSLVPIYGRALPGGIRDLQAARPGSRDQLQLGASASTLDTWNVQARRDHIASPRKTWSLLMANISGREGPQDFASERQVATRAALSVRHNTTVSTLWSIDYLHAEGNPSPGIIEYRATAASPILGPYRPLATFNAYGPAGDSSRDIVSTGVQYENQFSPELKLRSSLSLTHTETRQDTFTVGQLNLAAGTLTGTREPRRNQGELSAINHETSLTRTVYGLGGVHKPRISVEASQTQRNQESRGLESADIAALPVDARIFSPYSPNYYRPAYSSQLFRRMLTDQGVEQRLVALGADNRSAFDHGGTVITAGVYALRSQVSVNDDRPGALIPESSRQNADWNQHLGVNQLVGRYALVFANVSTATSPMTQVDRRTGEIKDNSTTAGGELGVRTLLLDRTLSLSAIAHQYRNENIPRRNPLYGDPVQDAAQTQPELVNSGEEQFRGLTTLIGYRPSSVWSTTMRATWTEAITKKSPDLPEEEGRQLQNLPTFGAAAAVSYRPTGDLLKGMSFTSSLTHIGSTVRTYAKPDRAQIEFPAYDVVGLSISKTWKQSKAQQTVTLSVSNLLDEDLLEKAARLGGERSASLSWSLQL